MNEQQIAEALRARLAALTSEVAEIETALQAPLDADFAEQAAELEGRDALEPIEQNRLAEIAAIQTALERLRIGLYGKCRVCGADIPADRLRALPFATTCIADAEAR